MKHLKTTTTLVQQQDLYFNTTDVGTLYNFGAQGQWLMDIIALPEVSESIKILNLLSMKDQMFPKLSPLSVFADFDLEDCKMVILSLIHI